MSFRLCKDNFPVHHNICQFFTARLTRPITGTTNPLQIAEFDLSPLIRSRRWKQTRRFFLMTRRSKGCGSTVSWRILARAQMRSNRTTNMTTRTRLPPSKGSAAGTSPGSCRGSRKVGWFRCVQGSTECPFALILCDDSGFVMDPSPCFPKPSLNGWQIPRTCAPSHSWVRTWNQQYGSPPVCPGLSSCSEASPAGLFEPRMSSGFTGKRKCHPRGRSFRSDKPMGVA